jgi:hypothetical protein
MLTSAALLLLLVTLAVDILAAWHVSNHRCMGPAKSHRRCAVSCSAAASIMHASTHPAFLLLVVLEVAYLQLGTTAITGAWGPPSLSADALPVAAQHLSCAPPHTLPGCCLPCLQVTYSATSLVGNHRCMGFAQCHRRCPVSGSAASSSMHSSTSPALLLYVVRAGVSLQMPCQWQRSIYHAIFQTSCLIASACHACR